MINAKTEFLQAVGDYKVIGAKIDIQESSESSFIYNRNKKLKILDEIKDLNY